MLDFKCNSITIGSETPLKCRYVILFDFQIVFDNQIVCREIICFVNYVRHSALVMVRSYECFNLLIFFHFQINQDSANQGARGVRKYVGPVNVAVQVIFWLFTPKTNAAQH